MKSIIQSVKECWVCKRNSALHFHHIYPGKNRQVSDKYKFTVYLCGYHHNLSDYGVHGKHGDKLDIRLKQECQAKFEETHTRQEFIKLIGKNYLN